MRHCPPGSSPASSRGRVPKVSATTLRSTAIFPAEAICDTQRLFSLEGSRPATNMHKLFAALAPAVDPHFVRSGAATSRMPAAGDPVRHAVQFGSHRRYPSRLTAALLRPPRPGSGGVDRRRQPRMAWPNYEQLQRKCSRPSGSRRRAGHELRSEGRIERIWPLLATI